MDATTFSQNISRKCEIYLNKNCKEYEKNRMRLLINNEFSKFIESQEFKSKFYFYLVSAIFRSSKIFLVEKAAAQQEILRVKHVENLEKQLEDAKKTIQRLSQCQMDSSIASSVSTSLNDDDDDDIFRSVNYDNQK